VPAAFRVIDTGLRDGRANIAFDQALIEARRERLIGDTIRFLRFRPTALVGRHQALGREIDLDHCRRHGIGIARRITGGGAIYFDDGQLGWELVFDRHALALGDLGATAAAICEAAAAGLRGLGVDARFRPRNDIEVEGRKLCGTGGFFDGDVLFYQGTLLIDTDPAAIAAALRIPQAKLARRGLESTMQRVVTLKELLGDNLPTRAEIQAALIAGFAERLGIAPSWDAVTEAEEALASRLCAEEIGTDDFVAEIDAPPDERDVVNATLATAGGTVTAYVRFDDAAHERVRDVLITGDFFIAPPRALYDFEAALRGLSVSALGPAVDAFFAGTAVDALTLTPGDFRVALEAAVRAGAASGAAANVPGPGAAADVAARAP
jgi:lipoate-protein ligase A